MSRAKLPFGAWDSHMHVTDTRQYPINRKGAYKPHDATLSKALDNARKIKVPNLVFVQPSYYGYDNSCLLDALGKVGPKHGRGVIVCDPSNTSESELQKWHDKGVRGVRINLKSIGAEMNHEALKTTLKKYDDMIRQYEWTIQIYIDLAFIPTLIMAAREAQIQAKIVVDHLGQPPEITSHMTTDDLNAIQGWKELVDEVENNDRFHVKISAPYRYTNDLTYKSLEIAVRELYRASKARKGDEGGGLVFASDWPHTRFEDKSLNIDQWIEKCLDWCDGHQRLADRLFKSNAEQLWNIDP